MFDNGKARLKKEVKRLFIFMLAISVFLFPISLEAHAFTRDDLCWNGYVLTKKSIIFHIAISVPCQLHT